MISSRADAIAFCVEGNTLMDRAKNSSQAYFRFSPRRQRLLRGRDGFSCIIEQRGFTNTSRWAPTRNGSELGVESMPLRTPLGRICICF